MWCDIKNYEGLYQVSNTGLVKSLRRTIVQSNGKVITQPEKILKSAYNKSGYEFVALCKDGKCTSTRIHRLVALHFIDNPEGLPQVNHIDSNKKNNDVENLEWCTAKQNMDHSYSIGSHSYFSEDHPNGKMVYLVVSGCLFRFNNATQASKALQMNPASVSKAINRGGALSKKSVNPYYIIENQ